MLNATVAELSSALAAGRVSSVELAQLFLDRIERLNATLNAFITVDAERALADARRADARRAQGEAGPLTGIPIAHKDIYCTAGLRTTCGSRMLENFVSPYDAHVVEQLSGAGMVMLGKTNMDEFAMGSSNETSYFGPVRNAWRAACVPGGSSGSPPR
jgi:aspartyl-tRNA(Asn)/glutamyl-tRNA(Gln) amidotransferase subunit A